MVSPTEKPSREVKLLPQLHKAHRMGKLVTKAVAWSQYRISRYLHDESISLPRSMSSYKTFIDTNKDKIIYVFQEGMTRETPPYIHYLFGRIEPRMFRLGSSLFPRRHFPKSFHVLSTAQKNYLIKYGGPMAVLMIFGKALWFKKTADAKLEREARKVKTEYHAKYGPLERAGASLKCLKYGNNKFRRTIFDKREKKALEYASRFAADQRRRGSTKIRFVFGAGHDGFLKRGKQYGFNFVIPAFFRVDKMAYPSRQQCLVKMRKLNRFLVWTYEQAQAKPAKMATYLAAQKLALDFIREGQFKTLSISAFLSIGMLSIPYAKLALPYVDFQSDLRSAINFIANLLHELLVIL